MEKLFIVSILLLFALNINSQTKWVVDKAHSKVQFTITHLVISEVTGYFKNYEGNVISINDDFSDAQIDFSVDINSINTDNEQRDNHLKSDDFFNTEKFPKMTFKSKSLKKVVDNKLQLIGDLTIRDITKEIVFDVVHNGTVKDHTGNTKAGFKITGQLNRFDYNLKWNALTELGGAVVDKMVNIVINLELQKT